MPFRKFMMAFCLALPALATAEDAVSESPQPAAFEEAGSLLNGLEIDGRQSCIGVVDQYLNGTVAVALSCDGVELAGSSFAPGKGTSAFERLQTLVMNRMETAKMTFFDAVISRSGELKTATLYFGR